MEALIAVVVGMLVRAIVEDRTEKRQAREQEAARRRSQIGYHIHFAARSVEELGQLDREARVRPRDRRAVPALALRTGQAPDRGRDG